MKRILLFFSVCLLFSVCIFAYFYNRHENLMAAGFEGPNSTISQDLFLKEEINVSIVKLISRPNDFHEKLVRVVGVGRIGLESNGLYLSADDYERHTTKNALSLAFPENVSDAELKSLKVLDGQYVQVQGTFDKDFGPFGLYSGTIRNVQIYKVSTF